MNIPEPMITSIKLNSENIDGVTVVNLDGFIDFYSSKNLNDYLIELIENQNKKNILLNCSKLEYLTSAGFRILIAIRNKLEEKQGFLKICCLNNSVLNIFRIAGLYDFFESFETMDAALHSYWS